MAVTSNLPPETYKLLEHFAGINNDALWIWNLSTNEVSRFGEYFYKTFGSNLSILNSPEAWNKLIHPDDRDRVKNNFKAAIEDSDIRKTEENYRILKTDGEYADISDKVNIIRNENGTATTVYGITTDITLLKKNIVERETRISELTKLNSDLKQFSYITSHNLRTPIGNLVALGELIDEKKIADPLLRKTLEKYKHAALVLNKTVNNLLELFIEKNNKENQAKKITLDAIFKEVVDSVETKIAARKAEITTDFSACNEVNLNPAYIHSIFLNFLTNALKYRNPTRKLQIKVFTEIEDNELLIYFSDNGLGIDLDKYGDTIFGIYQKFHYHPDSKGLGLHIVASQVKAMGGHISVTSQPGYGTTFTIKFKKSTYAE